MTTLTKEDLVGAIAEANGYPRNKAVALVETLLELIKSIQTLIWRGCPGQRLRKILRQEETG